MLHLTSSLFHIVFVLLLLLGGGGGEKRVFDVCLC